MSAYASLPGSFLPPFFSFGSLSSSSPSRSGAGLEKNDGSECGVTVSSILTNTDGQSIDTTTPLSHPNSDSNNNFNASTQHPIKDAVATNPPTTTIISPLSLTSTSPRPSDIIIAFRSARVDPVALIKSLTCTGSNIARRTASFIARTADVDRGSAVLAAEKTKSTLVDEGDGKEGADAHTAIEVGSERSSVISRPGLCYEDSDSDEELSMYDYSDDFSTPHDEDGSGDGDKKDTSLFQEKEPHIANSDDDPSMIEFELSITYQGRKYNATRGFPTFVKLREDLLHELKDNDRRSKRCLGGKSANALDGINIEPTKKEATSHKHEIQSSDEKLSVPELPRVSPDRLGHGGYALCGVARTGFALLQATAQHYCPEMERWMRHVIEAFPYSQSLSNFLWEPLSSSNACWENMGETKQSKGCCHDIDPKGKLGTVPDASVSSKPPLYSRSKLRPNNSSKHRYKTMGSVGSLNSIEEDDGINGDDDR